VKTDKTEISVYSSVSSVCFQHSPILLRYFEILF